MTALGTVLALLGTVLMAVATIGLLRLPDAYNKVNAVAKAAVSGVMCVLLGTLLLMPGLDTAAVLLIGVALQILTSPFGTYAIGRASYRSGAPLTEATHRDDLATGPRDGP